MEADGFTFLLGYEPGTRWAQYLGRLDTGRRGIDLPADMVPATFLVAEVDGVVVGRSSIRYQLNDFLAWEGGHIGYGILVEQRRRGYATDILAQSLVIARAVGVDRVLVTCDDDNVGSASIIERCGGTFEDVVDSRVDRGLVRRYWIN
ncbi:GNAT family N-acetyltransferase [soil metagenome]